jgi:hypothetical protein
MQESDIQKQTLDYLALKRIFHYGNNSGAFVESGLFTGRCFGPYCRDLLKSFLDCRFISQLNFLLYCLPRCVADLHA